MKKVILILVVLISSASLLFSQEEESENVDNLLSIGPYFGFKGGVNGHNVQEGRKNGLTIYPVPDFGATAYLTLLEDFSLAVSADLGYSAYSYRLIDVKKENNYDFHYGYLNFSPNFHFQFFYFGFNFGYPLHADFGESIDADNLNLMSEFRIGASYPIMYDEDVTLNVFVNFGYMLTGIYKDYPKHDPLKDLVPWLLPDETTQAFNPRVVSGMIGLNYLFSIDY